jgi:hypothetical protein
MAVKDRTPGKARSGALRLLGRALAPALHLLVPAAVAAVAGLAAEWTVLQTLAFAGALVLLWHTVLRWTDSEVFGLLRNPWAGLVVLAAFGLFVWWAFFESEAGHGGFQMGMMGLGGTVRGPDMHVRFASLLIAVAPAIPYAIDTLAGLFGLRDD